jgi:predicted amidohydrolase
VSVSVVIAQIPIGFSVPGNLETILDVLGGAESGDIVVTPEGALTGYPFLGQEERFAEMDTGPVTNAVDVLAEQAVRRGVHLWLGVCRQVEGGWSNEALGLLSDGTRLTYRKVNLATSERASSFRRGDTLPVFELPLGSGTLTVGVQLCRELKFPEQWRSLAERGAELILHLNHGAAGETSVFGIWRAMLVTRATENQRFVASANAAASGQHCPSMVVGPDGVVLEELPAGEAHVRRVDLELDQTADRYLGQRRRDLGF